MTKCHLADDDDGAMIWTAFRHHGRCTVIDHITALSLMTTKLCVNLQDIQ